MSQNLSIFDPKRAKMSTHFDFDHEEPKIKKRTFSVEIKTSFDNTTTKDSEGNPVKTLYTRLSDYAKGKGISEQDVIRLAVSNLLEKQGY